MDHGLAAFVRGYEEKATWKEQERIMVLLHEFENAGTEEERQEVARRARAFPEGA